MISTMVAEEALRASIAEARYKDFLDRQSRKEASEQGDILELLTMEVIDNKSRDTGLMNGMNDLVGHGVPEPINNNDGGHKRNTKKKKNK